MSLSHHPFYQSCAPMWFMLKTGVQLVNVCLHYFYGCLFFITYDNHFDPPMYSYVFPHLTPLCDTHYLTSSLNLQNSGIQLLITSNKNLTQILLLIFNDGSEREDREKMLAYVQFWSYIWHSLCSLNYQ